MGKNIKYALEPIYTQKEINKEKYKLLYGYIVSKCYVINDEIVMFPYLLSNIIDIDNKRTEEDIQIGFNTNYVDNIYDDYESAKYDCNIKNKILAIKGNKERRLKSLEKIISEFTKEMVVSEEKVKKLNR